MSILGSASAQLKQFAQGLVGPNRDALVEERDRLLGQRPPAPATMMTPPEAPPTCTCPHCTTAASVARDLRVAFGNWEGAVRVLDRQLSTLTWGTEKERDAVGEALGELCDELLRSFEWSRARPVERRVKKDARGRELAFETGPAIAEVSMTLLALYRQARERLMFLSTGELTAAIAAARAQRDAALALPIERPIAVEDARWAGTTTPPSTDESGGLIPDRKDPDILAGSIRFRRRA